MQTKQTAVWRKPGEAQQGPVWCVRTCWDPVPSSKRSEHSHSPRQCERYRNTQSHHRSKECHFHYIQRQGLCVPGTVHCRRTTSGVVRTRPAGDSDDGHKDNSSQSLALGWCFTHPLTPVFREKCYHCSVSKGPGMNHCSKIPQDLKHQKHTEKKITHSWELITRPAAGLTGRLQSMRPQRVRHG